MKSEIENIGWTLGNDCPYRCPHCYSTIVRNKGRNLEIEDVDRIVSQLKSIGVKTVNLGGNEPIFTHGPDPRKTVLPYIIRSLHEAKIVAGLTTSGITLTYLERLFPDVVPLLNDVDVSLDSPFSEEHNENRGASLYNLALRAISICREYGIDRTIIMCGMCWNLSDRHLDALMKLARSHEALIRSEAPPAELAASRGTLRVPFGPPAPSPDRVGGFMRLINFMKPTEKRHMELVPDAATFYRACQRLFANCKVVEMGEPLGSVMTGGSSKGCPCGTKSFRIHSITPDGRVPVSPCVYAHSYRVGDLLKDELSNIIMSREFEIFRRRRSDPSSIAECNGCEYIEQCRGGCPSRSYLWSSFEEKHVPIQDARDPYCLRDFKGDKTCQTPQRTKQDVVLVHRDYLCTLILDPL